MDYEQQHEYDVLKKLLYCDTTSLRKTQAAEAHYGDDSHGSPHVLMRVAA